MRTETTQRKNQRLWQGGAALTAASALCFCLLEMGSLHGFLIFPDEFAYWSYAAALSGYDWSDITSLGAYFSYGYTLILLPVFFLCRDAVAAYRTAAGLNFLLLAAAYILLARTAAKLTEERKIPYALFAALAVLAPWNLFYAQMTLTETLLLFLYLAAGYLLLRYLEDNRLSTLLLLLAALLYSYAVHMRTIGIAAAAMAVLAVHILRRKEERWHLLAVIVISIAFFFASSIWKELSLSIIYRGIAPFQAADNDYGGQLEKLRLLCTKEGARDLAVTFFGGLMYLGLATFGLFYWGLYALVRTLTEREKEEGAEQRARRGFCLFVLLGAAAQIVIASFYLTGRGEVDDYTYGRYSELILPFITVMGFAALWRARARNIWKATGALALVNLAAAALVVRQIAHTGTEQFYGYFMVGISYLHREGWTAGQFYMGAWLFGECLTCLTAALCLLCRSRAGRNHLLALLAAAELILAAHSSAQYLTPFKEAAFRDLYVADRLSSLAGDGRRILYLDNGERAYVGILQFMARDLKIGVIGRSEASRGRNGREPVGILERDILIFAFDDARAREWGEKYVHQDTYGHFTLIYND